MLRRPSEGVTGERGEDGPDVLSSSLCRFFFRIGLGGLSDIWLSGIDRSPAQAKPARVSL